MPKPSLAEPYATLELEVIETLLAGLHEWRSDLSYPESHSDMQGAVRALFRMFEVKRRPVAMPVKEMLAEQYKNCPCGNCQKMTYERATEIRDKIEELRFTDLQALNLTLREMYDLGQILTLGYGNGVHDIGEYTFEFG